MKINLGDFEIDIKAKREWETKYSEESALSFLNTLAIWTWEASESLNAKHGYCIAKNALEWNNRLHEFLNKKGYFKDLEEQGF